MRFDFPYICLEKVDSTNLYLKNNPSLWKPFLTIRAKTQTSGRGRQDRKWFSGKNNLTFSFLYYPKTSDNLSALTLFAGLACKRALSGFIDKKINIKWPNDIYLTNKKLGGILTELVEIEGKKAVIIGIGININKSGMPAEIKDFCACLEDFSKYPLDPEIIMSKILEEMMIILPVYTYPLGTKYLDEINRCLVKGNHYVSIYENHEIKKKLFNVQGVNDSGHLLILDNGKTTELKEAIETIPAEL